VDCGNDAARNLKEKAMKKGDIIPVSNSARKPRVGERWTETQTGERITRQPERFYHRSDFPIRAFAETEICTFNERERSGVGYIYEITAPAGTLIHEYGEESRFELNSHCQVRYIGRCYYRYGKSWRPGQHPTKIRSFIN
jgi:hypothetical protein